jgi:hypothetical protein
MVRGSNTAKVGLRNELRAVPRFKDGACSFSLVQPFTPSVSYRKVQRLLWVNMLV